ncbi:phosphoenolpyruvate-utilizing N-terminal domain-containing protein [Egibacter rhizosphaerae]|nr:phosphoenolpyruvate-utilizing N-terminal domain-containing protein [Egibacter rhizosphaerae]
MRTELTGRAASPGTAFGPAFVVPTRAAREAPDTGSDPDRERERVTSALPRVAADLEGLADTVGADTGVAHCEIFRAHAEFARDPELLRHLDDAIAEGASAEQAVRAAFGTYRELLERSPSENLAARAADLHDVAEQALDALAGGVEPRVPTAACVVVADELTPSQTVRTPREHVRAIACAQGSPVSHAAILARSLGIPAVVGVTGLLDAVAPGEEVSVDGTTGRVTVAPDPATRAQII